MRRFMVAVIVSVCVAAAMQIQVNAQQGGGRGAAAGGTTAGAGPRLPDAGAVCELERGAGARGESQIHRR